MSPNCKCSLRSLKREENYYKREIAYHEVKISTCKRFIKIVQNKIQTLLKDKQ